MMDSMQFGTYFDLELSKILLHHALFDFFSSGASCPLIAKYIFWRRHIYRSLWTLCLSFYANWGSDILWTEIYGQDSPGDKLTPVLCIAYVVCLQN